MWKILFTLFVISHVYAQTIYVDKNLNNNAAFHTIEEAVDNAQAGDTIVIKKGVYNERIYLEKSGTKLNPITIENYHQDEVIISGKGLTWEDNWGGLLHIDGGSHIKISGLTLQDSIAAGIYLDRTQYMTIENMKTDNTFSSGIGVWDSNHTLLIHNEIKLACNDGGEECISIVNSHDVNVTYNEVHDSGPGTNGGEGIDIKQGSSYVAVKYNHVYNIRGSSRPGLYADAWDEYTHHIVFESNSVHDVSGNAISVASEMGGLLEEVTFVNNLIYDCEGGGMIVGGWTADGEHVASNPVKHINIVNNTFYNVGGDGIYIDNLDAKNIKIYNNIIYDPSAKELPIYVRDGVAYSQLDIRKNLIDSSYADYGQNSEIVASPRFKNVNVVDKDFHLNQNSPAINNGINHHYTYVDYDKKSRTIDNKWDIGAFEYSKKEEPLINPSLASILVPILYVILF